MHIYLVTNLINGKMYVGQTVKEVKERWRIHLKCARTGYRNRLYGAIRKYGPEAFVAEGLTECDNQEQLNALEEMWIILLDTKNPEVGYNMTSGGDGCSGYSFSKASRTKMRLSALGRKASQATRDALSKAHKGKPKPLAQRKKIADAWTDQRRSMQASIARHVNSVENKKLNDFTCPTCKQEFKQVSRSVYGGHRKACLFWNTSQLPQKC
jgi:group I intron endonuclease